jgi:hypothetical protein
MLLNAHCKDHADRFPSACRPSCIRGGQPLETVPLPGGGQCSTEASDAARRRGRGRRLLRKRRAGVGTASGCRAEPRRAATFSERRDQEWNADHERQRWWPEAERRRKRTRRKTRAASASKCIQDVICGGGFAHLKSKRRLRPVVPVPRPADIASRAQNDAQLLVLSINNGGLAATKTSLYIHPKISVRSFGCVIRRIERVH